MGALKETARLPKEKPLASLAFEKVSSRQPFFLAQGSSCIKRNGLIILFVTHLWFFQGGSIVYAAEPVDLRPGDEETLVIDPRVVKGQMTAEEAQKEREREARAEAARLLGALAAGSGDYEEAIRYLKEALEIRPGDLGIRKGLGYVYYLRDRQKGIAPNPKAETLLDALQHGRGDWEASIRYLKNLLEVEKDKDRARAIREALQTVEGLYASEREETPVAPSLEEYPPRDAPTRELLSKGIDRIGARDYQGAVQLFQQAHEANPQDQGIRDVLNFAEGLYFAQQDYLRMWAEAQKERYKNLKAEAGQRQAEAQKALQESQKALTLSEELKDAEAATIAQRAISIARNALAKAQAMLASLDARLASLERARRLRLKGHQAMASKIKGRLYKKTEEGWSAFDGKTPLMPGDEVRTGPDGLAEFILTDGSTVQIGPESILILNKISETSSMYELLRGRFHAEMNCLKKAGTPCRYIRIGGQAVAVRGTEFNIEALPAGSIITVIAGMVEVRLERSGQPLELQAGHRLMITADGKIEGPTPVELRTIKRWWEQ